MQKMNWPGRLLQGLVVSFPFIAVTIPSGGSIIYTLLALTGLVYGWGTVRESDSNERRWWLALLLLFVLVAVSVTYSADLQNGVERLERFLRLASLALVFTVMVRWRVVSDRLFIFGMMAATLSLFAQALYEIYWLDHGFAQGLYHKIIFGDIAMLLAVLLFAAVVTKMVHGRMRLVAALCILMALYVSVMSATRGAWMVLPFVGVTFVWLYRKRVDRRVWWVTASGIATVLVVIALVRPAPVVEPIARGVEELRLFTSDPSQNTSWGARLNMWRNATLIWWQHPFFGTGIGDFNHDSRELVAQGRSLSEEVVMYGHAHSIYFDTLATLGVVGLLLMIVALFLLPLRHFYRAWQQANSELAHFAALGGLLTVVSFAVFGISEGWLSRNPFINDYVVYLALFAATLAGERRQQRS